MRFLRFVQAPLNPIELARFNNRPDRPRFKAPGRLARVGLLARMLDAGLVASLLVRGKVPGGTAAAAAIKYEAIRAADPRVSYHGRVIRQDGWVVLQYLFFYPMNDWRSTFDGANDHEADWEQAFVILEELPDGERRAGLVRRRRARRAGRGPATAVGRPEAPDGGRARRGVPGRRVARHLHGAGRVHHAARAARRRPPARDPRLGAPVLARHPQPARSRATSPESIARLVSVPFVDYARGDGYTVGPGQQFEWSPILIGDDDGWVDAYRGLWGLDTGDRMAGERAPAGPEVHAHRHGPPVVERPPELRGARRCPDARRDARGPRGHGSRRCAPNGPRSTRRRRCWPRPCPASTVEVAGAGRDVRRGGLPQAAGGGAGRGRGEAGVAARSRSAELRAAASGGRGYLARYDAGYRGDPRAHLSHAAHPEPPTQTKQRVFAETWAALSVGVLVLALAVHPVVPHPAGRSHAWPCW